MSLTEKEAYEIAFGMFAEVYPHEAAEQDWPRFVEFFYARTGRNDLTEEDIRQTLERTSA